MKVEDIDRAKRDLARALHHRAAELAVVPAAGTPGGTGATRSPWTPPGADPVPFFASTRLRSALLAQAVTVAAGAA